MLKPKSSTPQELYRQRKLKEERERNAYLPPGLINHGNTCFMNSVLQGLIATKLLHDLLTFSSIAPEVQRPLSTPLISSRSPQLTNGHGVAGQYEQPWENSMPIGDQFFAVMSSAWAAQSDRRRNPLSPKLLLNALGRKYQQYYDFAQQDAHEFLRILFDAMRMEEIDVIKKRQPPPPPKKKPLKRHRSHHSPSPSVSPPPSNPPQESSHSLQTDTTTPDTPASTTTTTLLPFPDMVFAGQLASILVCQKCKRISQTYEDFYDISLSINPEDYASPSSVSHFSPPFGGAANFFANSFKNVGKGKGKEGKQSKGAKDGKEGEAEEKKNNLDREPHHGRERRRDKFKKLARRFAALNHVTAQSSPRASSVPSRERGISSKDNKDILMAKAAGGKEVLRRTRSRSLDHFHRTLLDADEDTPEVVVVVAAVAGDGVDGREDEHEHEHDRASISGAEGSSAGREEMMTAPSVASGTVDSDWSVVREGDVPADIGEETVDELVVSPSDGKKDKERKDKKTKDKESSDGWTKLGKRISMSVGRARASKEKDREDDKEKKAQDKEKDRGREADKDKARRPYHAAELMSSIFEDIRSRGKSRESSPDPAGFGYRAARSLPRLDAPEAPSLPPIPPVPSLPSMTFAPQPKARPVSTPPPSLPPISVQLSPHTRQSHHPSSTAPSSRSQPPLPPSSEQERQLPQLPSLLGEASTTTLQSSSPDLSFSTSSYSSQLYASKSQDTARPSPPIHHHHHHHHLNNKHGKFKPRSPTPAETEYLRRILADIDVSGSKSSPTPSGGWPVSAPSSSSSLNPFALLIKSGGTKNKGIPTAGATGNETSVPAGVMKNDGEVGGRQGPVGAGSSSTSLIGSKWPSWLGMNRLSGVEECLRLFTSVEVLDNENMVGCRRCWKIANQDKMEEESRRGWNDEQEQEDDDDDDDDREDEDDCDDDDDDDESASEQLPPPLPDPSIARLPPVIPPIQLDFQSDTPGGMPIPIIATTEPEAAFEPSSFTPTHSRIPHPPRSNSADFVSLSALSLRKVTRLETENLSDASALTRNASSPSIPSALASPDSHFPPYALSSRGNARNSLVIPRVSLIRRRTRLESSTDGESDEYESGSAVEGGGEGEGTDALDADDDDGLSIRSSLSPVSAVHSRESSTPRSESDGGGNGEMDEGLTIPAPAELTPSNDVAVDGGGAAADGDGYSKPAETTNVQKKTKAPKKPKPVIMRPAYKRYLIATPPPILVVHLKRFQQMSKAPFISFTASYGFKKLDEYVTFPEYLDLTPFLAPKKEDCDLEKGKKDQKTLNNNNGSLGGCMYRLYAVVVHIGNMLGGHYIAYTAIPDQMPARPDTSSSSLSSMESPSSGSSSTKLEAPPLLKSKSKSGRPERQWAYISDVTVRLSTLEEVLKAKAYICMYERI